MANPRVRKIADRVQVVVAEMLERRIKDPRLGFVTVTDVRVSGDTQQATVFYTVLGEQDQLDGTAAALESAKGLIRSEVGKQLGMRHVPSLTFVHDALPENARVIDELLAKARESDAQVAAAREGAVPAGDPDPYRRRDEGDDDLDDGNVTHPDLGKLNSLASALGLSPDDPRIVALKEDRPSRPRRGRDSSPGGRPPKR